MGVEFVGEGDVTVAVEAVGKLLRLVAEVGLCSEVGVGAVEGYRGFVCPSLAVNKCPVAW
jgi:hypothetical protein